MIGTFGVQITDELMPPRGLQVMVSLSNQLAWGTSRTARGRRSEPLVNQVGALSTQGLPLPVGRMYHTQYY